jgi:glutamate formiminotransferase/formiminotetrahydrofolate cyclodeaminase
MSQLIECVPNFSEGRDLAIIKQITDALESVSGVKLLDVDPGAATNRTVVTIAGEPDAVIEAAYRGIAKAKELIDMRGHKGEHPRFGATDVCPLIPISGISMEETVEYARRLAKRVGDNLAYPVYLYESAALKSDRKNLATVRAGEYEGLAQKLQNPEWKPDFGPATFVPETGAIAIGARDFLLAVNFNLNTTSTRRANSVAFDVREAGRLVKATDANGVITETREPGTCKGTKAIGWYIQEYGVAQVSMNITDRNQTPLHIAFEESANSAWKRGMRVTGTEIVGLVPLSVLTDAGKYFLKKQQRSTGVSEAELIKIAVKSMGLDDLKPFDHQKKVLEYFFKDAANQPLIHLTLADFVAETASESPAPGGGSISAYMGSMGAALATMVANLSSHKRGWDHQWEHFSNYAEVGEGLATLLLNKVDEDTASFNRIMDAFSLPKGNPEEKAARSKAIQDATRYAIEVPLSVMEAALKVLDLCEAMANEGNPNSVSDAGVGALAARSAVLGAGMNVRINASSYTADEPWKVATLFHCATLEQQAIAKEQAILALVATKL